MQLPTEFSFVSRNQSVRAAAAFVAATILVSSTASAQDQFRYYFGAPAATNGLSIGGFDAVVTNNQVTSFWTMGFTTGNAIRKVDLVGTTWSAGEDYASNTNWVQKFLASSSNTNQNGNGTVEESNISSASTPGDIVLNPAPVTVGGITYPAKTLGIIVDGAVVRDTSGGGSGVPVPSLSKIVYAYDLRKIGSAIPTPPAGELPNPRDRDLNGNHIVDWNDAFFPIANVADLQTVQLQVQGGGTVTPTPNLARRFAYSNDGQSIYFNDAGANFGGIWKVNLGATGAAALSKPLNVTAGTTRINCEPAVLPSVRDLGAGSGDQVLFCGATAIGNTGGISFIVDNGATVTAPQTLLSTKQLAEFFETAGTVPDPTSITCDSDGNIYFAQGSAPIGVYLYDTNNRLAKVFNNAEQRVFENGKLVTTFNSSIFDTKVVKTAVDLVGGGTAVLPQVLFSDFSYTASANNFRSPVGAVVYMVGDFNRNNAIDADDITKLKAALGLRGVVVAGIGTTGPFTQMNPEKLKYDLNGATTVSNFSGVAIDWKDVKIFQKFAGLSDGDVDLDFDVDAADLGAVAANYNGGGKLFTQGNLTSVRIAATDKDTVNYADLVTLAANWSSSSSKPSLASYSAAVQADGDRAFAISSGGTISQYVAAGGGAWSSGSVWSGGVVPNSVGAAASLLTKPQNDLAVNVDGSFVVGQLNFDNYFTYTLNGGGTLHFNNGIGTAEINTFAASPTISAGVAIDASTIATVTYAADTLAFSGPLSMAPGAVLTKAGPGALTIAGQQTYGSGATLGINSGAVTVNGAAGGTGTVAVNINVGGTLNLNAAQNIGPVTSSGTLQVSSGLNSVTSIDGTGFVTVNAGATLATNFVRQSSLAIGVGSMLKINDIGGAGSKVKVISIPGTAASPTAKIDLASRSLVIDYTGAIGTTLTDTTARIKSGRGVANADGLHDFAGQGITSSSAATANAIAGLDKYAVAAISNADLVAFNGTAAAYGVFGGVSVDSDAVLIRYTYSGDANLDGTITSADYSLINRGFAGTIANVGWLSGDFNFDGAINADDYAIIDFGFLTQGGIIGAGAFTVVPEPASLSLIALGGLSLARRLRRRR